MMKSAKKLTGFQLRASDGDVGPVRHLLFESARWVVRYLVVDPGAGRGTALHGNRGLLVSPIAVTSLAAEDGRIRVRSTRAEVLGGPEVELGQAVSRRLEYAFNRYYRFPGYWLGSGTWGEDSHPGSLFGILDGEETGMDGSEARDETCYLTSSADVTGYRVEARDGSFGHVDDLLVDEHRWSVPYVIISARGGSGERRVLIDSDHIDRVAAPDARVVVELPRAVIRRGREL